MAWVEVGFEDGHGIGCLERLTGKHIEINVIEFFDKMSRDTGCFNELYESVALLGAGAEHDDSGRTVGDHVDLLDELLGKGCDCGFGSQSSGIAFAGIDDQMKAPTLSRGFACLSCHPLLYACEIVSPAFAFSFAAAAAAAFLAIARSP